MAEITSTATDRSSSVPIPSSTQGVISFQTVANTTACSNSTLLWDYPIPHSGLPFFCLAVTNIGVSQRNPPITLTPVNKTLVNQTNAIAGGYQWNPVNVPVGWYLVEAIFTSNQTVVSNTFFVANGTDTSCLTTVSPTSTSSLPSFSPTGSSPSLSPVSESKSNVTGIIAGSIFGAVGFILIVFVVFFCFWRRRMSSRRRSTMLSTLQDRSKSFRKGIHGLTESTGAIAITSSSTHSQLDHSSQSSNETFAVEAISTGAEKMIVSYNDNKISLCNKPESSTPNLTQWPRFPEMSSTHIKDSEFGVPLQERGTSRPGRRSEDSSISYNQNLGRPDLYASVLTLPSGELTQKESHRSSHSRRASRKPVPVYDESELEGVGTKEHIKSSVVDLSEKPAIVHHLMPDLPTRAE